MPTTAAAGGIAGLAGRLCDEAGFDSIVTALRSGRSATVDGVWGSSCALTLAGLSRGLDGAVLALAPRPADVDDLAADLETFLGVRPATFPALETLDADNPAADPLFGKRLALVETLTDGRPVDAGVVVTSLPALMQPVPAPASLAAARRTVAVRDEVAPEDLVRWVVDRGFERVGSVERPGEVALRGDILDLWSPGTDRPVRAEFFGDEVDGLRRFDPETQRKIETLDEVEVVAFSSDDAGGATASLLDLLPDDAVVAFVELPQIEDEARGYLDRLDDPRGLYGVDATVAKCTERASVSLAAIAPDSVEETYRLPVESIERLGGDRTQVVADLAEVLGKTGRATIVCHAEGERARIAELLTEFDAGLELKNEDPISARVETALGRVGKGFRLVSENLLIVGDHELFGRTEVRRSARRKRKDADSRAIDSFIDLNKGDLIVHLTHGIGRFRGMKVLEKEGQAEEHLELEFADEVKIFVPASLIHLVQKYIGAKKAAPKLSTLGGQAWAKRKAKVEQAVKDLAGEMLRLQAAREASPGLACPPPSEMVAEFADAFPYDETPDQDTAIDAVEDDLGRERPSDRLICGDVGYGKTEVAMRAAFRVIDAGRQVAVLVPTTVLCEQHARSFADRMAEFPVRIESLSRFRTKKEQREVVEGLKDGSVDVVIGTHRLVSQDVVFKDLGLLIIDEEQRFGVDVKDALKRARLDVDVVTLSATPIPRTLHLSLLGVRDISNLTTPPRDRQPVETRVTRWDPSLVRNALVRELNRGGQAFFVHNRVYDIKEVEEKIRRVVPEATTGIIHGQMAAEQVEVTLSRFVRGEIDVLIATTIIESGIDIPNANTMFIDQADRYGLADLHQLRGRVGRHNRRAYCYLLVGEGKILSNEASKRLKAIEEYSELGSGFKIAMRDLEIRGAGNILGHEQSGHITNVGYELYCQLLENAVRGLKGEKIREPLEIDVDLPVHAYIPNSYIPPGRQKVEIYRRLSLVRSEQELTRLGDDLRDRFGKPPAAAARLLTMKALQLAAHDWGVKGLRLEDDDAALRYTDRGLIQDLRAKAGRDLRIVDGKTAYWRLPRVGAEDDELLEDLIGLLGP